MRKKLTIGLVTMGFVLAIMLVLPQCAWSAFSLSVSPNIGGAELKFSPVVPGAGEINAEVNVTITTDIAQQYELRQEPIVSLRNAQGDEINWNNFSVRGLRSTNRYGTLKTLAESVSNSILYTSNQTGIQDSFTLVYALNPASDIQPGFYRGQLRFTLLPLGGSQASVYYNLYVIAEVQEGVAGEEGVLPKIEIATIAGAKNITLKAAQEDARSAEVLVKLNKTFKNMFNIIQVLSAPLESKEGSRLDYDALNIEVEGAKQGSGIGLSALSTQPQVIYTSKLDGTADESFVLTYSLGDISKQKAGKYLSRVQFFLEETGQPRSLLDTLELEVENERVFEIEIVPEAGQMGLQFAELKPNEPPRLSELTIEVKSNLGKPYQVSQNVFTDLTNKQGDKIPGQNFTLRMESLDTKGALKFTEKTEIQKGIMPLFVSDAQGSSDQFKLIYELSCPKDIKSGDYSTNITYSVSQI